MRPELGILPLRLVFVGSQAELSCARRYDFDRPVDAKSSQGQQFRYQPRSDGHDCFDTVISDRHVIEDDSTTDETRSIHNHRTPIDVVVGRTAIDEEHCGGKCRSCYMRLTAYNTPMRKTGHKATTAAAASMLPRLHEMFKGFADPTRIRILNVLAAGELCVCDIHDILELPQPLVSRHLARLRNAGLVTVERTSQFAHYRLASPQTPVQRNLVNCVKSCFKGIEGLDREREAAEARVAERKEDPC